jgi:glutamate--cysteine ligase
VVRGRLQTGERQSFGFQLRDHAPPRYEGSTVTPAGQGGIRELLEMIGAEEGLVPILDRGNPIGLTGRNFSISLEPGGQFELSGGIVGSLHETKAEIDAHIARVHRSGHGLGSGSRRSGFIRPASGPISIGCRRAVTRSCATICRRWGRAGST